MRCVMWQCGPLLTSAVMLAAFVQSGLSDVSWLYSPFSCLLMSLYQVGSRPWVECIITMGTEATVSPWECVPGSPQAYCQSTSCILFCVLRGDIWVNVYAFLSLLGQFVLELTVYTDNISFSVFLLCTCYLGINHYKVQWKKKKNHLKNPNPSAKPPNVLHRNLGPVSTMLVKSDFCLCFISLWCM